MNSRVRSMCRFRGCSGLHAVGVMLFAALERLPSHTRSTGPTSCWELACRFM